MKAAFFLEIKRIFNVKNSLVILLFAGLSLYFVYFGTTVYKDFLKEKKNFLNYENLKVHRYLNYEQYGFSGFRVLLQPSPLIVFCHSSILSIESNINTKSIINISSVYKGQKIFTNNGLVGDFSTLFLVLGSLLMLHFGLNTFISIESLQFHKTRSYIFHTLFCRFTILTVYFYSVIVAAYLFARVLGVSFSETDTEIFFKFSLFVMLFITLFYILGTGMAALLRCKKRFFISAYLTWFIIVFVVPIIFNMTLKKKATTIQSNEIVNIKKLNNSKRFEERGEAYFKGLQEKKVKEIKTIARQFVEEYMQKIVPLNKTIEENLNKKVNELITHHEKQSTLFPTLFYSFLSKESTGMGYYGYQAFLSYIIELKDNFFKYYFNKRYNQIVQSVESFVKNNENIFQSQAILPDNHWKGMGITLLYCLLLLGSTLLGLQRIAKQPKNSDPIKLNIHQLEMGKTYFYHSRDPKQKNGIINYLESKHAVIIDKPDPSCHDLGTSLNSWLHFEIRLLLENKQLNFSDSQVREILQTLGVTWQHLNQKIKNLDNEVFYSAYLALNLAKNTNIYVFDDFLYRVSKEFEQAFKNAIDKLKPHAVIIYLGSHMFDVTVTESNQQPMEDLRLVAVDLTAISLR
jgi:hypothetical protein